MLSIKLSRSKVVVMTTLQAINLYDCSSSMRSRTCITLLLSRITAIKVIICEMQNSFLGAKILLLGLKLSPIMCASFINLSFNMKSHEQIGACNKHLLHRLNYFN